jgi:hypothetical protein
MADKTSEAIKLNLRLPKPLHRRLRQQATRNNVSLNTEIVNQLDGYEAATIKRIVETVRPLLNEAMAASTAGATAGAMAIVTNFVQAFVEAGEQKPLTPEDVRWRERIATAYRILSDRDMLQQVGREMRAVQEQWGREMRAVQERVGREIRAGREHEKPRSQKPPSVKK